MAYGAGVTVVSLKPHRPAVAAPDHDTGDQEMNPWFEPVAEAQRRARELVPADFVGTWGAPP